MVRLLTLPLQVLHAPPPQSTPRGLRAHEEAEAHALHALRDPPSNGLAAGQDHAFSLGDSKARMAVQEAGQLTGARHGIFLRDPLSPNAYRHMP